MNEFDSYPFDPASPTLFTLQSTMPATDERVADFNSTLAAGEEKLTNFLRERVLSKNTSLYGSIPQSKRMTFAKAPDKKEPGQDLKAKVAEIEWTALKAVIDLVEVSQLVDLSELLEHRVVKESVALFNSNGTYRQTQKSQIIQKLSLQPVDIQEPYIVLIEMRMILRMAIPSAEDRQMQDGTPYKWVDYVHKLTSIILARHGNDERIICLIDPYDAAYSTKNDERDQRVQGNTHVPNIYMKLGDTFSSARAFSMLLCSISNKRRLQNLISRYLTDLAPSVDAEIIYSVGLNCTNLSTQQSMQNYSFDQSEADTVLFSVNAELRDSGYTGPFVIDAADTDAYVAAAFISQQLPGM
ncbi:hypothetical protein SK128_008759, partial [Halocaridina rubra]